MVELTDRCFWCFTAAMLVPLRRAPTWRLHTKVYEFVWNTFPNNARMKNRTELNLGKVFYVWLIYHNPDPWLNSLNGYDFYFWLRDTANKPFRQKKNISLWEKMSQPQNWRYFGIVVPQLDGGVFPTFVKKRQRIWKRRKMLQLVQTNGLWVKENRGSIIVWRFGGLSQFRVSVCGFIHIYLAVYG